MYHSDAPIKTPKEDLLNRANFAKRLAHGIINSTTAESYCIGLQGPWGSGKTSILNLILREIDPEGKDDNSSKESGTKYDDSKPIVIHFSPWNYSSSNEIIQQFFLFLYTTLESRGDKALENLVNVLKDYSKLLNIFGSIGTAVGDALSTAAENSSKKQIAEGNNLLDQKNKIIECLKKQKHKIIVVIDDLDRLSNKQIELVFQLVNAVANFPNTIYILVFDKDIVANALSSVQNCDGYKYIEKIVQLGIDIPDPQEHQLYRLISDELLELAKSHELKVDKGYLDKINKNIISRYVLTLRDLTRLKNTVSVKCDMIGEEINFADLVAITVIEQKHPALYRWIKDNKHYLVTRPRSEASRGKQFALISEKLEDLEKDSTRDAKESLQVICTLFPNLTNDVKYSSVFSSILRRDLHIGNEDKINNYFSLELDENSIPTANLHDVLTSMDIGELREYFKSISEPKRNNLLLDICDNATQIEKTRVPILVNALFEKSSVFFDGDYERRSPDQDSMPLFVHTIDELLRTIKDEDERFAVSKEGIEQCKSKDSIIGILSFLLEERETTGDSSSGGFETPYDIRKKQVAEQEKIFLSLLESIHKNETILDFNHASTILMLLERLFPEELEHFSPPLLTSNLDKLKYISLRYVIRMKREQDEIFWEPWNHGDSLIPQEEFREAFKACRKDGSLTIEDNNLNDSKNELLRRIFAYKILYETDEFEEIASSEVDRLIASERTDH